MLPENMLYYRGPRVIPPLASTNAPSTNVNYCQSLFTQIATNDCHGLSHLSVTPVKFGEFDTVSPSTRHAALNHEFLCYVQQIMRYSWLSTPLAVVIFHPPSHCNPSLFAPNLHVINMTLVAPSSGNSRNARRSSKMTKTYSITFTPLATVLRFLAISSILFASGTVTQLLISSNSRQQSSLSFVQFDPSR